MNGEPLTEIELTGRTFDGYFQADRDRHPHRWQPGQLPVRLERPGSIAIRARATDAAGRTQPDQPHWNPLGFAANPVHRVKISVCGAHFPANCGRDHGQSSS